MNHVHLQLQQRLFARLSSRVVALYVTAVAASPAFAQAMVGQSVLTWASNFIIAPLGIFSIIIALGSSLFRPELAKGAMYAAIICTVLFFITRNASALMTAMRQ